jgi:hypothetical protein
MIVRPILRCVLVLAATLAMLAATLAAASRAAAEPRARPGLLLGGAAATPAPDVMRDPRLPSGARLGPASRPTSHVSVACGLSEPVCVLHEVALEPGLARTYVNALEEARRQLVDVLGLPPPLPDVGLGPSPALDLYLLGDAPLEVDVGMDPGPPLDDRRSGFCRARPSRAEARRQAMRCLAGAILLRLDAAEAPFVRQAIAAHLWHSLGAPSPLDLDAIDTLQANPQLGLAARDAAPIATGAALLFDYLDARFGAGPVGLLGPALVQLSRGATPAGAPRWNNEPDVFDVLRAAVASSGVRFEDVMLDFAVERAFLGDRDDGRHRPELDWLGPAGRVRFDWVLPASSLPRRVAPRRPLEPLGAAYTWLVLDRVTLGKALAIRAEWEPPASFRWAVLTLAEDGRVLRRFDLPYVQNASSSERSIVEYDGAKYLLIVGTSLGGIDLAHPFDPDHEPFEPHGFTLYVTEL